MKMMMIVLGLCVLSTAAFADDGSLAQAAPAIHASSAGQMIRIYNQGELVDTADGNVIVINTDYQSLVHVADTVCDLSKQWNTVSGAVQQTAQIFCIAKSA